MFPFLSSILKVRAAQHRWSNKPLISGDEVFSRKTPKRLTPISLQNSLRITKSHNSVLGPEHSRSAWWLSLLVIL
uniref:Uncharacterized protein n=1 Tax=Cucumis melo TaxID=3656 RepID=A0A9I9EIU8_CUCME